MKQESNILVPKRNDQGETIKYEVRKYFRYWYWFALGIILAFIGAYIYLRYTPKIYSSSATIKILNKTKGLELPSSAFIFNRSTINLDNEIEIIKSYRIIEEVVKYLSLTAEYYEEGNVITAQIDKFPFKFVKTIADDSINDFSSYRISITKDGFEVIKGQTENTISIPKYNSYNINHNLPFEIQIENTTDISSLVGKTFILRLMPITSATRKLKGNINVGKLGKDSDLLTLSYSSQSKTLASHTLNNVVEIFNQDGVTDRQQVSKRTIDFIDERFKFLAQELDSIEVGIKDFKRTNNFINIESDAASGIGEKIISENQVFEIENQLILSSMLDETINETNTESDLLPQNIGLNNSNVNALISQYNDFVAERDKFAVSAGGNNPTVQILNEKISNIKQNINLSMDAYQSQLKATKTQLVRKNQKYAYQVSSLPQKEKLLRSRERQQAIKQTLYLFLLQKREESAINLAITEPSIKVVEYALTSGAPISPNSKNIYLFALVAGLFVPFGAIYSKNLLDTKIKGKDDVTSRVGNIPILAELPKIKKDKNLVFDNPTDRSVQSEAFRILSANVNYIIPTGDDNLGKVIYCTSTIKGEGKTYVGINLSLALSSINKKVLLIGADLRNPQIHTYISQDKNREGLSNYLHDESIDWRRLVLKGFEKHKNHEILLSGDIPPNPTQLLTNGRFEKLLAEAKNYYDYIIIDTAPTILVTDTLLISRHADATIYLLRAEHTEKNLLDFSKNLSDSGKIKNMAYVINGVGASRSYGYSYNYGYGYGYGSE